MKTTLYIFLLFFVFACKPTKRGRVILERIDKDTIFSINTNKKSPTNLNIHIVGFSNDSFSINNSIVHGGKIDDTLDLDWYSPKLEITFKHMKADSGQIRIDYALD